MSYTLVFALSRWAALHYCTGTGVLWGLFIIFFSCFWGQFGTSGRIRLFPLILTTVLSVVFLISAISATVDAVRMSRTIHDALDGRNESVMTVEGPVSACRTDPKTCRKGEGSFEVDGIVFDYKRVRHLPGYHGAGQIIREDGQQVRITYLPYGPGGDNVILRIEIAEEYAAPPEIIPAT